MSEPGIFDIQNDANEDIYNDIGDFHLDKELTKLEECNKAYSEDIERLSAKVKQLTEKNTELHNVNDILATNISILLKTAKAEIQRKQLVIDELRNKVESIDKRNYIKEDVLSNPKVCKICGSRLSKDNDNNLEDGEIVKNNSEEDDVKSEVGSHRNFKTRDKREHSGNHKKKKKKRSPDRSRGRSSDKYSSHSHRISRRSDDSRSHNFRSSRSRPRYKSPDDRRYSSRRERSSGKTKHSSDYISRSSSQKREYNSHGKEILRRSEESQRSRRGKISDSWKNEILPEHKSSTKIETNSDNGRSSSRPASDSGVNKAKVWKSEFDPVKNKTEERGNDKTDNKIKEKGDEVKKLSQNNCHEKKTSSSGNSGAKECDNNLFTRQSVLSDLYDEANFCSRFPDTQRSKNSEVTSDCGNEALNCADSSSDESWSLSFGKKKQVVNRPKTLYTKRMELRLKRQLKEEKEITSKDSNEDRYRENQEKCLEERASCIREEKEEGEISVEEDKEGEVAGNAVHNSETSEKIEEGKVSDENCQAEEKLDGKTSTNVDAECVKPEETTRDKDSGPALGESIIQKLLQLQKQVETPGIKEFSPLKNNYKLSKISPVKSVEKQHILHYYNLRPAQQLNNIDPEILDFSFSIPETPGKNFLNPFGSLDSQEQAGEDEGDKIEMFIDEKSKKNFDDIEEVDGSKGTDSNTVQGEETDDSPKFKKDEKETNPESKKQGRNRAKKKLKPDEIKENQTDPTKGALRAKENKDTVTYQIRTRSKTGNEKKKCENEASNPGEKSKVSNKKKSAPAKRKRELVSSEEDAGEVEKEQQSKRKRAVNVTENEDGKSSNEEKVEKEIGNEKELDEPKIEETSKVDDITHFEVFQSVSEAVNDVTVEEKTTLEELSLSNMSDFRVANTSCLDTPNKLKYSNESKLSLLSAGNSGDSSTFKVLRSYLMLSVNEESDVEAFSDDSTCSSGEYSDSGASAFVDLL